MEEHITYIQIKPKKQKHEWQKYLLQFPNGTHQIRRYRTPAQAVAHANLLYYGNQKTKPMNYTEMRIIGYDTPNDRPLVHLLEYDANHNTYTIAETFQRGNNEQ